MGCTRGSLVRVSLGCALLWAASAPSTSGGKTGTQLHKGQETSVSTQGALLVPGRHQYRDTLYCCSELLLAICTCMGLPIKVAHVLLG